MSVFFSESPYGLTYIGNGNTIYNIVTVNMGLVDGCEKELAEPMCTLKTYEFTIPQKVKAKPKQPKKPEVLTEEIKHQLKLIEKAFR